MKINKKFEQITFTFMMALGISCLVSFVMVLLNVGFSSILIGTWLKSWVVAFVVAFPAAYFLPRAIKKLMRKISFVES